MTRPSSRRELLGWTLGLFTPLHAAERETHQATGVKLGEITPTTARIWTRRTRASARNSGLAANRESAATLPLSTDPSTLEGSCPGAEGYVRVLLRTAGGSKVYSTAWAPVDASRDFTRIETLRNLRPATSYAYTVETKGSPRGRTDGELTGAFRTAPAAEAVVPVDFAMMTCQKYSQRDDQQGFHMYDAIRKFQPHFYLSAGDNVYYDSDDPRVNQASIARHHWQRMFSLQRTVECLRVVPGYWIKDDHDSYSDDCWPGYVNEKMNPFSFEEGLRIFPEQTPFPEAKPYRTVRWGRGLELWLLEGRDYRSANTAADGPGKSIWGEEQKQWLKRTLAASTADWKIVVSPTPVVGPDRAGKKDNHSNLSYGTEGDEFRRWLRDNSKENTFVLCGDRHWQYHSIDPATKVEEFGCGPASDSHAAGTPGENKTIHQFHRVMGGFLAVQVRPTATGSKLVIEHRDVHGARVYGRTYEKA